MKITVSETILSGNLFNESGYDENASADNLADLCEREYREILEREYPDAEIEIKVEAQHNVSGCGGDLDVLVEDDDEDAETWKIEEHIKNLLDSNEIWQERWDEWAVELTVDDLTESDVEWDGSGFSFPRWMNAEQRTEANKKYSMMAEYNHAYDFECTDIGDDGYLLYAKMRGMIDDGSDKLSLKNRGPYNEGDRIIVLVNAIFVTGYWRLDSHKSRIKFEECEETFDICRLLGIEYPIGWGYQRETRIKNAAEGRTT
jgi:hypothetical protein